MNRREILSTLGVTAAGLTAFAGDVQADDKKAVDAKTDPHRMHAEMEKCAKACADCQIACSGCFNHCAVLVGKGMKEHMETMRLCSDCADVCSMAARIVGSSGPLSAGVCEGCARACDQCGAACSKQSADKHMAACAKACGDCARACREMVKHFQAG